MTWLPMAQNMAYIRYAQLLLGPAVTKNQATLLRREFYEPATRYCHQDTKLLSSKQIIDREKNFAAQLHHSIPVAICRGQGVHVWDAEGKRYLDCMVGINQGHCHPHIMQAVANQAKILHLASRECCTNLVGEFLEKITRLTGFEKALLLTTGSEALDTSLKLAHRWGRAKKGVDAHLAEVVFTHGTCWGSSTSAVASRTDRASWCDVGPFVEGRRCVPYDDLASLEEALQSPHVVAFVMEPVQIEAGVVVPSDGYLRDVRELCSRHNVLWVADEVQTGLGRCGALLAVDREGVRPDVVVLGRSLGGGVYPVSCVLASSDLMAELDGTGHLCTMGTNPLGCAVAKEAVRVLLEEQMADNADMVGEMFRRELRYITPEFVTDVRGRGLLSAFSVVTDSVDCWDLCVRLKDAGLLTRHTQNTHVRLMPPLVVTQEQTCQCLEILEKTFKTTRCLQRSKDLLPPGTCTSFWG